MRNMKTIKEWELEKGIEIKNPKNFLGKRSQIWNRKYTEEEFKKACKTSEIRCKTEKGLAFLNS